MPTVKDIIINEDGDILMVMSFIEGDELFKHIKNNDFNETLKISKMLLGDEHDLIHKATGWMLREVGKKSLKTEEKFLKAHYKNMPRTMLRYAIERFPEKRRQMYLKGKI